MNSPAWKNKLFFGDNLKWLREGIDDESVDLVYLDPPFNSNANYNVLFTEKSGDRSGAQIEEFEDTWHWGLESEALYHETVLSGGRNSPVLSRLIQSGVVYRLRTRLGSHLGIGDQETYSFAADGI